VWFKEVGFVEERSWIGKGGYRRVENQRRSV